YNPSAVEFAGKLYIIYRNDSSEELYSAWFDGTGWAGNEPVGVLSQFNPGVLVFEGKLVIVFKIEDSVSLSWAWFDGSSWGGGGKPIETANGNFPQSNYNPELALMPFVPASQARWMADLPDDMVISNINLPGTHDSAAITRTPGVILARHYESITGQLLNGVR